MREARRNEKWRLDYMTLEMRYQEKYEQGLAQGLEQGLTPDEVRRIADGD